MNKGLGVHDVGRLLEAAHQGDCQAAAELLPLVYDELRKRAAANLAAEKPSQPLISRGFVRRWRGGSVGMAQGTVRRNAPKKDRLVHTFASYLARPARGYHSSRDS